MPRSQVSQRKPDSVEPAPEVRVSHFYDEFGVKEWLRLQSDVRARVIYHLHKSLLSRYVRPGERVLDAGCGPGRFSIELEHLGAKVTAGDISAGQLALAEQSFSSHLPESPPLVQFSVTKLPFADAVFDCAIAYGAVLSHAGDRADVAAAELVRVTRPGGLIILSVLPKGNDYLPYLLEQVRSYGLQAVDEAVARGENLPDASSIPWREFSHEELEALATGLGCGIVGMSASNVLSTVEQIPLLQEMERDSDLWRAFLQWEEELGVRPSNTERGAFIIAVLRKHSPWHGG
jgi:ubiquinone/menaquinone biosynthesis C-methylase UbiE